MQLSISKLTDIYLLRKFLVIKSLTASVTVQNMKKIFLPGILFLSLQSLLFAQKDTALERRLQDFLMVNENLDLEKVMDLTYPKLFTIVPKDQMLEVMKNAFDNDEVTIKLDSLRINTILPVFKMENGSYAKVIYSMQMLMAFKDKETDSLTAEDKEERNQFMLEHMGKQYGGNNVSIDSATGAFKINVTSLMVAVKDSYAKEWSFINLKENDPLTNRLFSKALLNKLTTYK